MPSLLARRRARRSTPGSWPARPSPPGGGAARRDLGGLRHAQVMVAFVIAFFPVVVTGVDGLRGVDPALGQAARTLGAGRVLDLPPRHPSRRAAGDLLGAPKMAAVFAVTGAVVAEYVGADRGLGLPLGDRHRPSSTGPQLRRHRPARRDRHGLLRPRRAWSSAWSFPTAGARPGRPGGAGDPHTCLARSLAAVAARRPRRLRRDDGPEPADGARVGPADPRLVPEHRPRGHLRRRSTGLLRGRGRRWRPRCRATRPPP